MLKKNLVRGYQYSSSPKSITMAKYILPFEDLSIDEQTAVTQLKRRMIGHISQEMFEDLCLFLRFLRARSMNINNAETMLRDHLEWRKMIQVETIITDYCPKEICKKFFPLSNIGIDKDGAPILYFHFGRVDSRGILKSCRKVDVIKSIVQWLEENVQIMKKQSIKLGKLIDKWTIVMNFEDLPFSVATHKQTLEVIGNLLVMYEGNYPERLKVAYLLNASMYFTMAFSVVKHFLSGPTIKKIKIFGKDGWKDELLKVIDSNVLPEFLGGNRTDPDGNPMCQTILRLGGTVPQEYYTIKKHNSLANLPGVEKLTVTRMSRTQLTLAINEAGSHIEWEFETKNRDIAFSLLFKKNSIENQTKVLIPKQRIDTDVSSETGMYKCERPGIYIIEFDNSYSWIYQKEIFYRVSIVKNQLNI